MVTGTRHGGLLPSDHRFGRARRAAGQTDSEVRQYLGARTVSRSAGAQWEAAVCYPPHMRQSDAVPPGGAQSLAEHRGSQSPEERPPLEGGSTRAAERSSQGDVAPCRAGAPAPAERALEATRPWRPPARQGLHAQLA